MNLSLVAQTLQSGNCRDRNGSRLLERQIARFQRECSILADSYILGKGPEFSAEHFVTGLKPRDVPADCFDSSRKVDAQPRIAWFPEAGVHAHDVRGALHVVPVK